MFFLAHQPSSPLARPPALQQLRIRRCSAEGFGMRRHFPSVMLASQAAFFQPVES